MSYLEATERAQRRIAGEDVPESELPLECAGDDPEPVAMLRIEERELDGSTTPN